MVPFWFSFPSFGHLTFFFSNYIKSATHMWALINLTNITKYFHNSNCTFQVLLIIVFLVINFFSLMFKWETSFKIYFSIIHAHSIILLRIVIFLFLISFCFCSLKKKCFHIPSSYYHICWGDFFLKKLYIILIIL